LRENHRESAAEVSGAVEIDEKSLRRIEAGTERPSEDILLLLISHFALKTTKQLNFGSSQVTNKPHDAHDHEPSRIIAHKR